MNIPSNQVDYRRRIGRVGSRAVFGIGTIGGLHLVVASRDGGGFETLGAGSHPGIARHIAKRHAADIFFNDMAKSETVGVAHFQDMLPQYEAITAQLREAHGD
jgi:threonine dehydrogenase-like Zn-dependent dehydrogenase